MHAFLGPKSGRLVILSLYKYKQKRAVLYAMMVLMGISFKKAQHNFKTNTIFYNNQRAELEFVLRMK